MTHRILIVSDDPLLSSANTAELQTFEFKFADDCESAFDELLKSTFNAAVVNLAEGPAAISFIKRIRATPQLSDIPILVTAEWGTGYVSLALSEGADGYEPTPFNVADLMANLKRLLTKERAVAK